MDRQAIFDKAARHLAQQGRRSYDDNVGCHYRAPNGDMCGVGPFIPNEVYTRDMECKAVGRLLKDHGGVLPDFFVTERPLLPAIQAAHDYVDEDPAHDDHSFKRDDMRSRLADMADTFGLNETVLNEVFPQ